MVPVNVTAVIVSGEVLVFFTVRAWAALVVPTAVLAKVSVDALSETVGAAMPVPLRATDWGEPVAESVTLSVAVSAPVATGLRTATIAQLDPAARELGQLDSS